MKYFYTAILLCFISLHLQAQTACESIEIPNIFTPNHDSFNDTWVMGCIDHFPDNDLTVFDRQGQQIYFASGYDNNWDGTWDQTKGDVPIGTYIYLLKVRVNGEEKIYKGTITIQR